MTATVDKFGRIVIPKKLRDRLGITPGSPVNVTECEGHLELAPIETDSGWEIAEDGLPVFTGTWPSDRDLLAESYEHVYRRAVSSDEP